MNIYLSNLDRTEIIQLPVLPSEVEVDRAQKNETYETINNGDYKAIGKLGLRSINISSFFHSKNYAFLKDNTYKGMEYVDIIEKWRESGKPIRIIITDLKINMAATVDNFKHGFKDGTKDVYYSMSISEYREEKENKKNTLQRSFSISMTANIQDKGIVKASGINSCKIGTTGQAKRLEMFTLSINGIDLKYKVHEQDVGDTQFVNEGLQVGSIGQSRRIEGIQINVTSIPSGYKLQYRVHVESIGWTGWVENGQYCGTRKQGKRIEAIEVRVCTS
ncbi:MAG: hypothetical protein AB6733_10745 [Clostridiaceae bacterium]